MASISPTVLVYLKKLDSNNNREWFTENKKEYELARVHMENFAGARGTPMVHAAGWCCRYVCSMCFTGSFKRLLCAFFAPRYKHGEIEISPKESLWGD